MLKSDGFTIFFCFSFHVTSLEACVWNARVIKLTNYLYKFYEVLIHMKGEINYQEVTCADLLSYMKKARYIKNFYFCKCWWAFFLS